MKVGVIQSNYIPWRGYFDFIDDVDLFIFYDDVQYTKNDWRNRNKIKTVNGTEWITVPVLQTSLSQLIQETKIDYRGWNQKHIKQLRQWYAKAPYFNDYYDDIVHILSQEYDTISSLNVTLCKWIMRQIGIETITKMSSEFVLSGDRKSRLLDLLKQVNAKTYISGPAAKGYIDNSDFIENGIGLEYKRYEYPAYPQLWGNFTGEVSVLDLIFNTGKSARKYLKSLAQNEKVVSI